MAAQSEILYSPALGEVWVITLDDVSEHLRVSQCSLRFLGKGASLE